MKAVSLFSSAGVSELYLDQIGVNVFLAQELLEERANFYKYIYKNKDVVVGDIRDKKIYNEFIRKGKKFEVDLLIATPPCQGLSSAGKCNWRDERNELFLYAIEAIIDLNPKYVLFENVSAFLKSKILFQGKEEKIIEIIEQKLSKLYEIEYDIVNALDYGVPQSRRRAIVTMTRIDQSKKFYINRNVYEEQTVRDVIGDLPTLEALISERKQRRKKIDWSNKHFSPIHNSRHVQWMRNTPSGCSAFDNDIFKPIKANGDLIKGFKTTYKRIEWDKPAPTITMMNGAISSQNNVHPGRLIDENQYSDARVLTILELMRLSTIPDTWDIPDWCGEHFVRQIIGEGIPPLMTKRIIEVISNEW